MAINVGMGFKVGNMEPIDARFIMSKAEMLAVTPATQPDVYFCVCSDDSLMYVYDSSNSEDATTGKFRCVSTGAVDMNEYQKVIDDALTTVDKTVPGAINELLNLINEKVALPELEGAENDVLTRDADGNVIWKAIPDVDLSGKLDKPAVDGTAGQVLTVQEDGTNAYQDVPQYDDTEIQEAVANKLDKPEIEGSAGQILVLQDDGSLAYQDNVTEFDDTELRELIDAKLNKPEIEGTAGQILVLQDDGSLAYADNVTEFDDTEIQEELDTKLNKPEIEGTAGQILVLQDDGSLAYQDNVTEFDDTAIQEALDTKLDKDKVVQNLDAPDTESVLSTEALNTVLETKVDKVEGSSLVPDTEIAKIHEHANQDVLDNLTKDADSGKLLFEGTPISAEVNIATVDAVGTVKPDGTTITIADDGTISVADGGAAGGDVADFVSNTVVGAIQKNTDLTGKTSMEILKMALVSYVNPSATVSYSQPNTVLKKGQSFDLTVTVSGIVKGTNAVEDIIVSKDDGAISEQKVYDPATSSYEFTFAGIDENTVIHVKVIDTEGKYFSTSKTYSFVDPYYIGATDNIPTADTVLTLTELIEAKSNKTKKVTAADQYVVYAYPASYGSLSSVIDGNGFENLTDYTKISLTINGVAYNCYHTTGKKSMTNFSYTYKH